MLIHFLIQTKKANYIMDRRQKAGSPFFNYKRNVNVKGNIEEFKVYYTFKTKK